MPPPFAAIIPLPPASLSRHTPTGFTPSKAPATLSEHQTHSQRKFRPLRTTWEPMTAADCGKCMILDLAVKAGNGAWVSEGPQGSQAQPLRG